MYSRNREDVEKEIDAAIKPVRNQKKQPAKPQPQPANNAPAVNSQPEKQQPVAKDGEVVLQIRGNDNTPAKTAISTVTPLASATPKRRRRRRKKSATAD
jgi:outer membrane biosynthesis protein TonB